MIFYLEIETWNMFIYLFSSGVVAKKVSIYVIVSTGTGAIF